MPRFFHNFSARLILPFLFFFFAAPVYADYASLQTSDCTLIQEGDSVIFTVINSSINCSPYTLVGSTTPTIIQVFSKCANGDILNPRFDVFTYDGTRGNEVGHSTLYKAGENFPYFACDNVNRNVDGTLRIPLGTNQSFFVAVSDTASSTQVKELFENGVGGGFAYALIHFDIKSAPTEPSKPDPVIIIPGVLGSSDKNGVWVIDPIFHTYDDLIATLKANGYVEGADLFTFPYDWRQSNIITAVQLRDKINEVQNICHCAKVDLVAHSMGGLVARQYIQSDKYEGNVDQLIFLGTPHLGAPKSYLMWEGGENDVDFSDRVMKFILSREARKFGFASLFDYVRNKPISSVQELLPIYDYLRDKDSGVLRAYPNNYPQNIFLENLKIGVANLLGRATATNIVGDLPDSNTINSIRVVASPSLPLWENGYPDGFGGSTSDRGLERGSGDVTVPLGSSEFIASDLNIFSAEHNLLPTAAEGLVFKKLTGKNASITFNTNSLWNINFKLLLIKILSPVDVLVTAPDGKKIGKDFATNSEVNQIDGAFYSGFLTDDEYITIPNPLDGEYKVEVQGTGSGSYTVATGYISDTASADKDFTAQTQTGLVTDLTLNINSASTSLDVKPVDITPPTISIISPTSRDYLRLESMPINVSAIDTESGVFSKIFKFDDKIVNNGSQVDLFFEKLGSHIFSATATDFVGNSANAQVGLRVIATLQSTISDIERAYSLGWIDNQGVKESFAGKIKNNALRALLNELEAQRGKHINDKAYNLLKEDANWMLNN